MSIVQTITWLADDGRWLQQSVECSRHGSKVVGKPREVIVDAREAKPDTPPIERWLWMNWVGKPWPKRIRLRWPVYIKRLPGCGCVSPMKKRWLTIKAWIQLNLLRPLAMTRARSA